MEDLNAEQKQRLRALFKQKRKALSAAEKRERDKNIFSVFRNCETFKNAETLLVYCSTPFEPDTREIIGLSLKLKKRVALPRTKGKGDMDFVFINALLDLKKGRYGIYEPTDELCETFLKGEAKSERSGLEKDDGEESNALCIVPGLCFDKSGNRIGYGGGYYDRFLKDFCGKTMGLCYDECFLENIPRDGHDISVDLILTETGLKKADGR